MERITRMTTIICLLALIAAPVFAQARTTAPSRGRSNPPGSAQKSAPNETHHLAATVKQLTLEVRKLKVELYKLQLDQQQMKIAQLRRELQQAQADKLQLAVRESDLNQEIADLEAALSEPTLTVDDRAKLEAAKASLEGSRWGEVDNERQALAQREAELTARLEQEQRRLQKLVKEAERLKAEK